MPGLAVIGYDGSADSRRAIAASRTLDVDRALVVNVWQAPLAAPDAGMSLGGVPVLPAVEDVERLEAAAHGTADEGAALAREAGLRAEAVVARGDSPKDIGSTLARIADERAAAAVVVGRRGMSRLEAVVLGSVSDATVREARCPVLVVPAPDED
jgi:nucleotide-binding universal stress UspA family protein